MADKENVEESNVENASEQTDDTPKTYSEEEVKELVKAADKARFDEDNAKLSRMGAEVKRLQEQPRTQEPQITSKLISLMETGEDYTTPERLTQIRQLKEEVKRQEDMAAWEAGVEQKRTGIVQKIEEAGIDPNDESLNQVWDAFEIASQTGRFQNTDSRLDRVLSKTKKVVEKPKETKETDEVIARRWMKEQGQTTQDTGGGGGGGMGIPTDMDKFRQWISGISQAEYEEKYAADVNKMMQQGKIK